MLKKNNTKKDMLYIMVDLTQELLELHINSEEQENSETFNEIYEYLLKKYNSYRLKEIEEIFKEFGIENSQDLEEFYINYSSEYTNRVLGSLI